ncbi:MAG TPA: Lsr2 family protein [Acidimicrobiales bacterium]|nr:Lsr2 family protein [Acidimicrobiales bacterium]
MAQEVFVSLTDDLDGSEADETIMFALDGAGYEIDLNAKNAAALRKALDKYVANARKSARPTAGRRGRPSARRGGGNAGPDPKAVRLWAQENGLEISSRGRVPAEIIDRYRAAGGA